IKERRAKEVNRLEGCTEGHAWKIRPARGSAPLQAQADMRDLAKTIASNPKKTTARILHRRAPSLVEVRLRRLKPLCGDRLILAHGSPPHTPPTPPPQN